jgi:hypothetical protein
MRYTFPNFRRLSSALQIPQIFQRTAIQRHWQLQHFYELFVAAVIFLLNELDSDLVLACLPVKLF